MQASMTMALKLLGNFRAVGAVEWLRCAGLFSVAFQCFIGVKPTDRSFYKVGGIVFLRYYNTPHLYPHINVCEVLNGRVFMLNGS